MVGAVSRILRDVFSAVFPVRFELEVEVSRAPPARLEQEPDPVLFASREPAPLASPADSDDEAGEERRRKASEDRRQRFGAGSSQVIETQLDQVERPGFGPGGGESRLDLRQGFTSDREGEPGTEVGGAQPVRRFAVRTPDITGGRFPVEGGPPLEHHHRLVGGGDARERRPRRAVFRPGEPFPEHRGGGAHPVHRPERPQPGEVSRPLHDPSAAVHNEPLPGDRRQHRALLLAEPVPAAPLDERGNRPQPGLEDFIGADPCPADRFRKPPGGPALPGGARADQNHIGEPGSAGSRLRCQPPPPSDSRTPRPESASQNPGKDFPTTSGLSIRTPGTRRPTSASAMAIR